MNIIEVMAMPLRTKFISNLHQDALFYINDCYGNNTKILMIKLPDDLIAKPAVLDQTITNAIFTVIK